MGTTLFQDLQTEFCPALDSSLIAACLTDITFDAKGNPRTPTTEDINIFRNTLRELANQAELSEQLEDVLEVATHSSEDTPSTYVGDSTATSTSISSGSVLTASSSPIGFLQAALPHIDADRLDKALNDAQRRDGDMDLWDVIAGILTDESIREMEERGFDAIDIDDGGPPSAENPWATIGKVGRQTNGGKNKNKNKKHTIAIADIRQQHHVRLQPTRQSGNDPFDSAPASDAWSQMASLATHVASLVTSETPNFFQSHLHSPKFPSPYAALTSALFIVRDSLDYTPDDHIPSYLELLNVVLPMYDYLDAEEQSRLVREAELSIVVTEGREDDALDLVILLRELDADSSLGYQGRGIYHSPQPSPTQAKADTNDFRRPLLPSGPPPVPPPPLARSSVPGKNKPSPYQWQAVHKRKAPQRLAPVVPLHVPAYTRDVNGTKVKGGANGKEGKGEAAEVAMYKKRVNESMRKRDEMLKEATRSWQRGNNKSRGGEVALFFAERARQFQEMARKDSLELAKIKVDVTRLDAHAVDLHGTTATEAVYIVREILTSLDVSGKPLTVVTGRGSHSVNQVSVLKPALRKALTEDGYTVSSWEGGLHITKKITR